MTKHEYLNQKIVTIDTLQKMIKVWELSGQKIVFTNGCFDIIHPGHIAILTAAAEQGNRLIVGLNTDASVKRLKGEERPINDENARAIVLSALAFVDAVVLFDEDTPYTLIQKIQPDVLVKGGDYKIETIVGADIVQQKGGTVFIVPTIPNNSTTEIVGKILKQL